jgi:dienelactone hydrolase
MMTKIGTTALELSIPHGLLVDEAPRVHLTGCPPGELVTVEATTDVEGSTYAANARFVADAAGSVDTSRAASVSGTYTGVDPFGLWWSGNPVALTEGPGLVAAPIRTRIRAETGEATGQAEFERLWLAPDATIAPIRDPGVCGLFARPAGSGPFPSVVAFAGSGGGMGPAATWAPILASHGFATLAIAYFGLPGLPEAMVGIEVEVVERAIRWLHERPDVRADPVALMGMSRGSELALWAASLLDPVAAVVAFAPSGVSWSGLDAGGPVDEPAWTFRSNPLPYAAIGDAAKTAATSGASGPVALKGAFEHVLAAPERFEQAVIPVEAAPCPMLFVSGDDDAMWPSGPMAEIAIDRARQHGTPYPTLHLHYRESGHICAGVPGTPIFTEVRHPLTGGFYSFGGTRAGNAQARADSWPRVLAFLRDAWPPADGHLVTQHSTVASPTLDAPRSRRID